MEVLHTLVSNIVKVALVRPYVSVYKHIHSPVTDFTKESNCLLEHAVVPAFLDYTDYTSQDDIYLFWQTRRLQCSA